MTELNFTLENFPLRDQETKYITQTVHVFGITEIICILSVMIGLGYFYYYTHTHKDTCEKWINDNGREVNLYKISTILFWSGTGIIIILGIIEIIIARSRG